MLATGAARASDDADTEAAKRHFAAGLELYGLERYVDAIREFEAARVVKPLPAFDFNIGRCHERLERWAEAVAAYERFLAAAPPFAEEAMQIRERLGLLKQRIAHPTIKRRPSASRIARILGPIALGTGAAALVAGTGAYLSVYPDYADAKARCAGACQAGEVTMLWARVQRAEAAGIGLWSAGAALMLVGIPITLLGRIETRVVVTPVVAPGLGGVSVGGAW